MSVGINQINGYCLGGNKNKTYGIGRNLQTRQEKAYFQDSMKPVNDTVNDKYAPGVNHTQLCFAESKIFFAVSKLFFAVSKLFFAVFKSHSGFTNCVHITISNLHFCH